MRRICNGGNRNMIANSKENSQSSSKQLVKPSRILPRWGGKKKKGESKDGNKLELSAHIQEKNMVIKRGRVKIKASRPLTRNEEKGGKKGEEKLEQELP